MYSYAHVHVHLYIRKMKFWIFGEERGSRSRTRVACARWCAPYAHQLRAALAILTMRIEEGKAVRTKEEHELVVRARVHADDQMAFWSASGVMREDG